MLRKTLIIFAALSSLSIVPLVAQGPQPAATAFERLKGLEGQWIDIDGAFGKKGAVAVTYKVTSGGHSVIEVFPVGTPHEMTTIYYRDGSNVVLTHYCADGTQPRMRAKDITGNTLKFDFDGGPKIEPAQTTHMHDMTFEFVSNDEIKAVWQAWAKGKPDHVASMHLARKK